MIAISTTFITYHPEQTRRNLRLETSRARSHAARVTHRWRKRSKEATLVSATESGSDQRQRYNKSDSDDSHLTETPEEHYHSPHSVALRRGNSDPFDSLAIAISPEINRLITFVREDAIPSLYCNELFLRLTSESDQTVSVPIGSSMLISTPAALRVWQQLQDSLEDECTALARLAGYASMMAQLYSHNHWARLASLEMRTRSAALLRKRLGKKRDTSSIASAAVASQIYGLFRAECLENNVEAAAWHAQMLKTIFADKVCNLDRLLSQALYDDVGLALMHTHRPFLDVDRFVPRVMGSLLASIAPLLPVFQSKPGNDDDLHFNVTYRPLREKFLKKRAIVRSIRAKPFTIHPCDDSPISDAGLPFTFAPYQNPFPGDIAYIYVTVTGLIDTGQLIGMYLDLTEGRVFEEASVSERHIQAGLVIALQYLAWRTGRAKLINGIDLRDASDELMKQLRYSIQVSLDTSTPRDVLQFQDAYLWLLYVGALDEQKRLGKCRVEQWFLPRLKSQAYSMRVVTWPQMHQIARSFVYGNFVEPDGSVWFENIFAIGEEAVISGLVDVEAQDGA